MFGEMKPLMDAAQSMVTGILDSQIEDAQAEIAAMQRKIKRLKKQRSCFDKIAKELSKPPKPFKPLTKAQMKKYGLTSHGPVMAARPAVGI